MVRMHCLSDLSLRRPIRGINDKVLRKMWPHLQTLGIGTWERGYTKCILAADTVLPGLGSVYMLYNITCRLLYIDPCMEYSVWRVYYSLTFPRPGSMAWD